MVRETKEDRRYRKQAERDSRHYVRERLGRKENGRETEEIGKEGRERERETRNMTNSYGRRNRYMGENEN